MQKRLQSSSVAVIAILGLALILPSAPAEASEVVKLARLVITGKRLSADRLELVARQKTPAATEATAKAPALPAAGTPVASGQDVLPRAATAAQTRGLLSFF